MASQKNLLLPLLLLSILVVISGRSTWTTDVVSSTCRETPDPEMCEETLRADPRTSKASDPESLILIMIDAVKSHFSDSLNYAEELSKKSREKEVLEALKKCVRVYRVVLDANVVVATKAVKQGDPKFGEQAMVDSANEADACNSAFPPDKVPPELPARTRLLRRLSTLAASLIKTME